MKMKVGFGDSRQEGARETPPSHPLPPHSLSFPGSQSQKLLGVRQLEKVLINKSQENHWLWVPTDLASHPLAPCDPR